MRPIRRRTYIGLALLVFALTLVASSAAAFAAPTFNRPIDNDTHIANAISLSTTAFASGVSAAVVTSGDGYADSLTAAVLARAYAGPLLLSSATSLSANVASELTRLKPGKVFLVGLPASFAASVKAALSGLTDANIVVLKGADRYETAALVAAAVKVKVGTVSKVVIAPGDSYGFALAASSLAAAQGWPLLLMPAAGPLPQSAKDVIADLGVTSGIVVGTDATLGVSDFTVAKRIIGTTSPGDSDGRYDTAAKLADYAVDQGWLTYAHVGVVYGDDFPDGEAAAAFLAKDKGVLLFSKTASLQAAASTAIKAHGAVVKKVDIVGLGWPVFREVKGLNSGRVTALSATGGPTAGGNKLVVTGTCLDKATKVRVGKKDVASGNWKVDSATQITISSVPSGYGDGPVEVTVSNYWGASPATTKDLYWYGGDGVLSAGEKVVQKAVEYLGVPYLWGGAGPTNGFDCSGLCLYVYKQFAVSLPHYSRSMATYGTAVAKTDLQPGDLVFFYTPISHVGMYVGGGMMINAPRSGDLVCIEDVFRTSYVTARRMVGSVTPAPPPPPPTPTSIRYEQTDSHIAYGGTWVTFSGTGPSAGAYKRTCAAGSSATIAFKGTYLAWVGTKGTTLGKAKVSLDGGTAKTIDLAAATVSYQQKLWETGTLSDSAHTVTIRWDASNAAGLYVSLDAVDVIGTLTTATAAPFTPPAVIPATTRYEQKDTRFTFAGGWIASSSDLASGTSFRFAGSTATATATATATFNGTYLVWVGKKSPDNGQAKVTVDGGVPATVDLYDASATWQQQLWNTGVLPAGDHTVKIEWTGVKNANSLGASINVDAFEIAGTVTQAPAAPAVRYEQTDSRFAYAGTWTNSSSPAASGGTFRFSNTKGSAVTVTFTGSSLSWIAKKSPVYGNAKVTVDGGTPVSVDLYHATEIFKQKVWDTGALVPGTHTVKIEWAGTKNSAATGTNIGADAFDIIGTLK